MSDKFVMKLNKSGYGCYMGPYFCGALVYAKDNILMSPSVVGTKQMLHNFVNAMLLVILFFLWKKEPCHYI